MRVSQSKSAKILSESTLSAHGKKTRRSPRGGQVAHGPEVWRALASSGRGDGSSRHDPRDISRRVKGRGGETPRAIIFSQRPRTQNSCGAPRCPHHLIGRRQSLHRECEGGCDFRWQARPRRLTSQGLSEAFYLSATSNHFCDVALFPSRNQIKGPLERVGFSLDLGPLLAFPAGGLVSTADRHIGLRPQKS